MGPSHYGSIQHVLMPDNKKEMNPIDLEDKTIDVEEFKDKELSKETAEQKGDQTLFAYIMAMLFWIMQSMPATKQAFQDRRQLKMVVSYN